MVACLEEIAYHASWISAEKVSESATAMGKTEYGRYLLKLVEKPF